MNNHLYMLEFLLFWLTASGFLLITAASISSLFIRKQYTLNSAQLKDEKHENDRPVTGVSALASMKENIFNKFAEAQISSAQALLEHKVIRIIFITGLILFIVGLISYAVVFKINNPVVVLL